MSANSLSLYKTKFINIIKALMDISLYFQHSGLCLLDLLPFEGSVSQRWNFGDGTLGMLRFLSA